MLFGNMLDVGIGLVLVYLLLGLIVTALQELVSGWLQKRGKGLEAALKELLDHDGSSALFTGVWRHPLVQAGSSTRRPSYLSARNFSSAVFSVLTGGSASPTMTAIQQQIADLPDGSAKAVLTAFVQEAGTDLDVLRKRVETWFDDAMDRASGLYKRYTQAFALLFGIALAAALNVDSINLATTLWAHPDRSTALVAVAQRYAQTQMQPGAAAPSTDAAKAAPAKPKDQSASLNEAEKVLQQIPTLQLPIGWTAPLPDLLAWLSAIIGWLITGLAVSLGAPFWFDLLNTMLNIRASGPKPARSEPT